VWEEDMRKGCRRVSMVEYYVHMYKNGKMRPAEMIILKCLKNNTFVIVRTVQEF
jgi:hypothetical protein